MLEQVRAQWRYIVTAIILVAIAAGALAAGVSVLAQGQGDESAAGARQPAAASANAQPSGANAAQSASGVDASPGVAQPQGEPTPRPPMGATYHTVGPGETLGKIAAAYGVTTVAIANANGLANPNMIRVGQRLIIPAR